MQFERKISEIGGSIQFIVPADLGRYLGLKIGDTVIIQDDEGKHGKFVSFWKKDSLSQEDIKELLIKESGVDNGKE